MSYQPNRWGVGLVPLAVLWVLGTSGGLRDVESTLSHEVEGLIGGDIDGARVTARGRDVALHGEAFSHDSLKNALDKAGDATGVRSVEAHEAAIVAAVTPYAWWVVRDGGRVTTSGVVPDPKTKAALDDALKDLGELNDRTTYGRGLADGLPAAAAYAAQALGHFNRGSAVYTDGSLDIDGVAADPAGYAAALALAKAPPAGVKLGTFNVAPPVASPFVFTATRTDAGLTLAGAAPSAQARVALDAAATKLFTGVKVDDKLELRSGASGGEVAAAQWALEALSKLKTGKAELADEAISLSGQAGAPGDIEAVAALATKAPAGFRLDANAIAPAAVATYAFGAEKGPDGLYLTGFAPNAATRQALASAAAATKLPVTDHVRIAAGLPKGLDYKALTAFALAELAGLDHGKVKLAGDKLSVNGATLDWKQGVDAEARAKAPPAGTTLADLAIDRPPTPDELAVAREAKLAARKAEAERVAAEVAAAEAAAKAEEQRKAQEAQDVAAAEAAKVQEAAATARNVLAAASAVAASRKFVEDAEARIQAMTQQIADLERKATDAAKAATDAAASVAVRADMAGEASMRAEQAAKGAADVADAGKQQLGLLSQNVSRSDDAKAAIDAERGKAEEAAKAAQAALAGLAAARQDQEGRLQELAQRAEAAATSAQEAAAAGNEAGASREKVAIAAAGVAVAEIAEQVGKATDAAKSAEQSAKDAAEARAAPAPTPNVADKAEAAARTAAESAAGAAEAAKSASDALAEFKQGQAARPADDSVAKIETAAKSAADSASAAEQAAKSATDAARAAGDAQTGAVATTAALMAKTGETADAAKSAAEQVAMASQSADAAKASAAAAEASAKIAGEAGKSVDDAKVAADAAKASAAAAEASAKAAQDAVATTAQDEQKRGESLKADQAALADLEAKASEAAAAAKQSLGLVDEKAKAAEATVKAGVDSLAQKAVQAEDAAKAAALSAASAEGAANTAKIAAAAATAMDALAAQAAGSARAAGDSAANADQVAKAVEAARAAIADKSGLATAAAEAAKRSADAAAQAAQAAQAAAKPAPAPTPISTPTPVADAGPPNAAELDATTPLTPPRCETDMLYVLNTTSLAFALGKATLAPASAPTLDRLARLAGRCTEAKLEISGFTDNLGDADFNKYLSKQRADAVVSALSRRGVAASRLAGAGYGADRPAASNDTEAGRAKNRRIEIHVK